MVDRAPQLANRTPWLLIALLTAAAVLLRAIGLNSGLWFDEIATLTDSVRLPLRDIVSTFPSNNQHTFFSVLAHLSVRTFGEHAWSLRLPALLFGAATVPMLYFLAREFAGRAEALLASLLLAAAYHHVWFSQNARGYSALAFLTVTSTWLLLRVLRTGRTADAVWYGIAAALGVYAHLTMVFLVMSHALLCVGLVVWPGWRGAVAPPRRVAVLAIALAAVFTIVLYSPVLLDLKQFFVDRPADQVVATPRWAVAELIRGLQIGWGAGLGAALAGVLLLAGAWRYYCQSPFILGLFLLPGAITIAGTVAMGRPIFPRFLFFLIGFGILILVRGALEVGRWISPHRATLAGTVIVLMMAAASLAALAPNYRYPKQDFEGAMRFVDANRGAAEPVVTVGLTGVVYRGFYGRDWEAAPSRDGLQAIRARGQRVWVLYTLERYIASDTPELMKTLQADCAVAAVFRGTVGNGDITVCTAPPIAR